LIEDTKKGVVIHDIVGSFSFNPHTEKFGFEGKNVFFVENGEQVNPVFDTTVAGNIKEILFSIVPGDDIKQEGLFFLPSMKMAASIFV
jgi:predicted Zn-dependent protease